MDEKAFYDDIEKLRDVAARGNYFEIEAMLMKIVPTFKHKA